MGGLTINTNVQAISATRNLQNVHNAQSRTLEKLSSGSRINSAADDAAGLAISENLRSSIRSSRQASRNANDGIALIQTAEGGLNEVSEILLRMRELSIQAANDTLSEKERTYSNKETQQLNLEIERIAQSTKFNGMALINGEGEKLDFQIGISNDPVSDRLFYNRPIISSTLTDLGITEVDVSTKESSRNNLDLIDEAIGRVSSHRAELGAVQNRMRSTIQNLGVQVESLSAANSNIRDTDVAVQSANLAKDNILSQSATMVLSQAKSSSQNALQLLG
ncbi:MAG: flagellin FliC [Bacteriovoracaceae bacterium]|nr:flagellin FliC [Bacteriovoracaceae bacterium]